MFGTILTTLLQIMAVIPSLITTAEIAFSGKPGNGPAKKELVMEATQAALIATGTMTGKPFSKEESRTILDTVSGFTDAAVEIVNSVDGFNTTKSETLK